MLDVFLDALFDSLKIFILSFLLFLLISFFEDKFIKVMKKHQKLSPILGASVGLIPQCGFSVVAADLYVKQHITIGTLFAVFFACSDEAFPILLSSGEKSIYILPLLGLKFLFGFLMGYLLDLFFHKASSIPEEECDDIEHKHTLKDQFLHSFIHALKIFIYVFVVNMIFGTILYFVAEERIINFLSQSKYLTPLVCGIIGLIPNCASSVLITQLFTLGGLPFGALFTGLSVNAGLGLIYLLKNKKNWKDVFILSSSLFITSVLIGYGIIGFMNLF